MQRRIIEENLDVETPLTRDLFLELHNIGEVIAESRDESVITSFYDLLKKAVDTTVDLKNSVLYLKLIDEFKKSVDDSLEAASTTAHEPEIAEVVEDDHPYTPTAYKM